jgi:hypothetical protein
MRPAYGLVGAGSVAWMYPPSPNEDCVSTKFVQLSTLAAAESPPMVPLTAVFPTASAPEGDEILGCIGGDDVLAVFDALASLDVLASTPPASRPPAVSGVPGRQANP